MWLQQAVTKLEQILKALQARFEVTHISQQGANGQIQYASINNGQPGYKLWVVARKQQ
ncbi:MAG: hypothetical protein WC254_05600 [Candidatus Woesearchaeota archaeon]|jgi:hypothetical protein